MRSGLTSGAHFQEALEVDVVECLDDRTADLLRDPRALRLTILDRSDATVTARIVVAGVDHDDLGRHARKEIARQIWHGPLGNGDDHDLTATRSLSGRHGGGANLGREDAAVFPARGSLRWRPGDRAARVFSQAFHRSCRRR